MTMPILVMSSPGEASGSPTSLLPSTSALKLRNKSLTFPLSVHRSESLSPNTPISAGLYRLDPGPELVYTYTYDEMKIIVDGDFEISDETGKSVKAAKGDVFFFPKGSKITFRTEKGGLGFYCGQRKSMYFSAFSFSVEWRQEVVGDVDESLTYWLLEDKA